MTPEHDYRQFLADHYDVAARAVRYVVVHRRLGAEFADDLLSALHLKLVERNYAALRRFKKNSSLSTYLIRIADRLYLDMRTSEYGRWRPSRQARRMGAMAQELEKLLWFDRLSFDQACQTLFVNLRISETPADLERLRDAFPRRAQRPRLCSLQHATNAGARWDGRKEPDPAGAIDHIHDRLDRALATLPRRERHLIEQRFWRRRPVSRVARDLGLDQRALYRDYERIYGSLRTAMTDVEHVA